MRLPGVDGLLADMAEKWKVKTAPVRTMPPVAKGSIRFVFTGEKECHASTTVSRATGEATLMASRDGTEGE